MRRLLAVAVVTAAAFAVPAAPAYAYDCGGLVDIQCTGHFCRLDCFSDDCLVWLDPLRSPHSALCVSDVTQVG